MFTTDSRGVLRVARWESIPWLVHGFSTRRTGDFVNWPSDDQIGRSFGTTGFGLAGLRQIHSQSVVSADHAWGDARPEADASVTDRSGVLVGVRTADCVPILLVDADRRAVAAVHAGWRGAASGVLTAAVRAMETEYGCAGGSIDAAIGPAIRACCFEVGEEVAEQFDERHVDRSRKRPHVDLASVLRAEIHAVGIRTLTDFGACTQCDTDKFYSHRGEHGQAGRMLAVVGIREEHRS